MYLGETFGYNRNLLKKVIMQRCRRNKRNFDAFYLVANVIQAIVKYWILMTVRTI